MSFNYGQIIVAGVSLLIAFLGISCQVYAVIPHYGGWNLTSISILIPFNILLFFLCWNYYLTCITDPGKIPENWEPKLEGEDVTIIEVKKKNNEPRFCRTCAAFKPPRSHHCSSCERCVLKMDHHCPWVNGCVGHHNYGYFIRFLFFVDVTCSVCLYLLCVRAYEVYDDSVHFRYWYKPYPSTFELIMLLLATCGDGLVLILVGFLSGQQFWSMSVNTTTIEGWENEKIDEMVSKGRIEKDKVNYPYHLGVLRNIKQVLGDNPWLWLWPSPVPGDGLNYPVADGLKLPVIWPPPEYIVEKNRPPNTFVPKERIVKPDVIPASEQELYQRHRRGSEGYIVPNISMEQREKMSNFGMHSDASEDFSENYIDDDEDSDDYVSGQGYPRSSLYYRGSNAYPYREEGEDAPSDDSDTDDQPIGERITSVQMKAMKTE